MTSNQLEELSPLPEADNCNFGNGRAGYGKPWYPVYTADQMRAYAVENKAKLQAKYEALQVVCEKLREQCNHFRMPADKEAKNVNEAQIEQDSVWINGERYLYIRSHSYVEVHCDSPRDPDWKPESLDAEIDAARAAMKKQT